VWVILVVAEALLKSDMFAKFYALVDT
jgi:hypothetical protein